MSALLLAALGLTVAAWAALDAQLRVPLLVTGMALTACAVLDPRARSLQARGIIAAAAVFVALLGAGGARASVPSEAALIHLTPEDREVARTLFREIDAGEMAGAMATLVRTAKVSPVDTHRLAHAVGMYGYLRLRDPGAAFEGCTPDFRDGCYHGVMQTYLQVLVQEHGGDIAPAIRGICDFAHGSAKWSEHCWHGLGHGLGLALGSDQYRSTLALCDTIPAEFQDTCYYGIFMEARLADLPRWQTGQPQEYIREDRPHYPCDTLPERYANACYTEQVKTIFDLVGEDFTALGRACADGGRACFRQMGNFLANRYEGSSIAEPLRHCAGTSGRDDCVLGVIGNPYIRVEEAPPACAQVSEARRRECAEAVGRLAGYLVRDEAAREALCARLEAPYVSTCRRTAVEQMRLKQQ